MERFLWVCLGSAVGGGMRYLVAGWTLRVLGGAFPYGTLAVNLLGSFALGALMVVGIETTIFPPTLRLALTTGVMGALTTYSTFNYETLSYMQDGAIGLALTNILVTVLSCLVAGAAGWSAARWFLGV